MQSKVFFFWIWWDTTDWHEKGKRKETKGRECWLYFIVSLHFNNSDGDLIVLLSYITQFFYNLRFIALYFGDLSLKIFAFGSQILKAVLSKFLNLCKLVKYEEKKTLLRSMATVTPEAFLKRNSNTCAYLILWKMKWEKRRLGISTYPLNILGISM